MRLSGSRMRLAKLCLWWAQRHAGNGEDAPGRPALMGTALHALVEGGDSAAALAVLTEDEIDTVATWHTAWLASRWAQVAWQHEVAFAWDPATDTARVLETNGHRDYSKATPEEIVGTADLVLVDGGRAWVCDIKTGFGPNAESVAQHSQLKFLALCVSRAFVVDVVVIQVLRINGPRLEASEAVLEADDLDAVAQETRAIVAAIPGAEPQSGDHCTSLYCPAFNRCPRTQAIVAKVETAIAPEAAFRLVPKPESDEHAIWLNATVKAAEKFVEECKRGVREYIDQKGGIPTRPGYALRQTNPVETISTSRGEWAQAESRLIELGLGRAIEKKVSFACSKTSIREEWMRQHPDATSKEAEAAVESVVDDLRRIGVVGERPSGKYEERKTR